MTLNFYTLGVIYLGGASTGLFCLDVSRAASGSYSYIGGRLAKV